METIQLDTMIMDGMYMDIHSIEFNYDSEKLKTKVKELRKVIEDNGLSSVTIDLFSSNLVDAVAYFDSTQDDEEKSEDCNSRIDTELLLIYDRSIYYRGYSKWTSDFLEVDLSELI